jgi:hypothetical protein
MVLASRQDLQLGTAKTFTTTNTIAQYLLKIGEPSSSGKLFIKATGSDFGGDTSPILTVAKDNHYFDCETYNKVALCTIS